MQDFAERMPVGVVVERRQLDGPWASERWTVAAIEPAGEAPAPWALLAEGEGWQRFHAGVAQLELFRSDTAGYRDNLQAPRPTMWVILRRGGSGPHGIELHGATVDPAEIEAHSDAGDDIIEAVSLPMAVALWMTAFVARHHVERSFWKRRRDRADPEVLARRRPLRDAEAAGHG
jgi:hypothetical protein